jgi:succinate dehydrogenase / fumarate reductase flavoprotein subunit
MAEFCRENELLPLPDDAADEVIAEFERIRNNKGQARQYELRSRMQKSMTANVGVFRVEENMQKALDELADLRTAYYSDLVIDDKGHQYNTDLLEAWELGCLLELAQVTAISAVARKESRGGHARDDFQKRDDVNWLKHTLCYRTEDGYRLAYKPVELGRYEPKERVY